MDLGLKAKVAVVAASSKGLGRAAAEALAREGANLALCSRDEGRIRKTADDLKQIYGVQVFSAPCDVTDQESVKAFGSRVLETFGTVHILFTNAGGPAPGDVLEVNPKDYENALQLNLVSAINLVYAFLPAMQEQGWGRIIASTSITVKQPIPMLVLSNVSRVGLIAFVKSLSEKCASRNITANAVAPGYILTERVKEILEDRMKRENISYEEALKAVVQQIPAGRAGDPEEFGALVAFLASERASYINGETILIDGGMHRGLY